MAGSLFVRHLLLPRWGVSAKRQEALYRRRPLSAARGASVAGAVIGVSLAFGAGAGELGFPASALGEFAEKNRPSFETAPPLAAGAAAPAIMPPAAPPAEPPAPQPAPASPPEAPPPAVRAAPEATGAMDEYEARCFVKIDGKVVVSNSCRILRDGGKSVVFEIEDGPLTIDQRQGRVWTARLKDRDFGNVYKTGECWGAHGFYACDRGRK
ncbi:hypothetical protein CQW49_12860 [Methylosinus trichosporium OB3b]|uniref:Uncharacterized protein n=1 Tax=Methylosinus trichosporium (strain ATCC 35070 / NCIMB 11131 / UNIQEM 75 / OB3b) TaxID=595536 RepID=A0A2D2D0Z7_METT3|nr:hypothetical protein CQW49_12860 [Methylosinus trichosporium OB3b]OBS53163.1 hypothetical protein A8B73_07660 [Methylosinus sp. 3S-1]